MIKVQIVESQKYHMHRDNKTNNKQNISLSI
jgi:hypothetical protein